MRSTITVGNDTIKFTLRKTTRNKHLKMTIRSDGLLVTMPKHASTASAEKFVKDNIDWIRSKMKRVGDHTKNKPLKGPNSDYLKNKDKALKIAKEKLNIFGKLYGLKYKEISIKNTSSRWGSCSKKGNLNFHYKIVYLPDELADYLVVHELCHLKEMNHSERFWRLVEREIPDHKKRRKLLQNF